MNASNLDTITIISGYILILGLIGILSCLLAWLWDAVASNVRQAYEDVLREMREEGRR